jgi:two-component system cell cycle response regulator CpdR
VGALVGPAGPPTAAGTRPGQGGRRTGRILVAEDDRAVREFIRRALELQGHAVTAVEDGGRALEALDLAEYDLLLSDIVMPRVDGIALAEQVSVDRPALPIVLIASDNGTRPRIAAMGWRLLSKPFDRQAICTAVAEALQGYRADTAAITGREPR